MSDARRRLMSMMVGLWLVVGVTMSANYLVNPYGAWRVDIISDLNKRVDQERVMTPYLLRTVQPETLLVGNSRVYLGMPIEQDCRDGLINGGISGATLEYNSE